jgi:RNA polymerase sigma-70 factor (ECF subfamily)
VNTSVYETRGPLEQLTELVRSERRALVAMATREGLSGEEALECVQDALCMWLARHQAQAAPPSVALSATLKTMVRNQARNWRRRHRRLRPHLTIDGEPAIAARADNAEQLLDSAESALRLHTCVAELREVERSVISMRLLEERSGEDVAALLGLSRAHVDVLVHRAKATLRVCMAAPSCSGG